jgi:hypothetical protein
MMTTSTYLFESPMGVGSKTKRQLCPKELLLVRRQELIMCKVPAANTSCDTVSNSQSDLTSDATL